MTLEACIADIEGIGFRVRVNVASDFRTFLRAVRKEAAVNDLARLAEEENASVAILRRVRALTSQGVDYRYEHPQDSAIATYLLILSTKKPAYASLAAEIVVSIPRLWWASRVATELLDRSAFRASSQTERTIVRRHGVPTEVNNAATESVLWGEISRALEIELMRRVNSNNPPETSGSTPTPQQPLELVNA